MKTNRAFKFHSTIAIREETPVVVLAITSCMGGGGTTIIEMSDWHTQDKIDFFDEEAAVACSSLVTLAPIGWLCLVTSLKTTFLLVPKDYPCPIRYLPFSTV